MLAGKLLGVFMEPNDSHWERLIAYYTRPGDIDLVRLSLRAHPSQEDLDRLLDIWDIEVKGGHKSLLLSYFQKYHPELDFHEDAPRLKGLFNFYRFNNIRLGGEYKRIVKALNAAGIIPLIIKGGAMRHIRPNLPRTMGDMDVIIRPEAFDKAVTIITGLGYEPDEAVHSVDFHKEGSPFGILDVHRYIPIGQYSSANMELIDRLFARSTEETVFTTRTRVPTHEDLLFILLINLARNLLHLTSIYGLIYSTYDCHFLQADKPGINWDIVFENAELTQSQPLVGLAMRFMEQIVPGLFPEQVLSKARQFDITGPLYWFSKRQFRKKRMYGKYLSIKILYNFLRLTGNKEKLEERLIDACLAAKPDTDKDA